MTRAVLGFVALCVMAACSPVTHGPEDMERVADNALDHAESAMTLIANKLGATITFGGGSALSGSASEGAAPVLMYEVVGRMVGPKPTQESMESALVAAGFEDVRPRDATYESRALFSVLGVSADGSVTVSFSYVDNEYSPNTYFITFYSVEQFRVHDEDLFEFRVNPPRTFNQSLVDPSAAES